MVSLIRLFGELQGLAFGVKSYGRSGNYSLTLAQSVKWPSQYKKEQVVNASVGIKLLKII